MAYFAEMTIMQTLFPKTDEDILECVLEAHDGDVEKARIYLEKKGGIKADETAVNAMKPRENVATKEVHLLMIVRSKCFIIKDDHQQCRNYDYSKVISHKRY